jgi:hypothetical protein
LVVFPSLTSRHGMILLLSILLVPYMKSVPAIIPIQHRLYAPFLL